MTKWSDIRQMAREIRGFVVGNKVEFSEAMDDYCYNMTQAKTDAIEDAYHEMLGNGEFDDVKGIQ